MVVCQYFLKGDCRFGDKCRYEHPSAKKSTVCPHFLNGYCRFGDKCWNEHPRGGGKGGFGQQQQQSSFGGGSRQGSSGRGGQWSRSYHNNQNRFEALSSGPRDTFGSQHTKVSDGEQTISQIKKTIESDMEIWGMSKQWPLSCYTYTKEEPCLQGLLDFCPEEIRLEAYRANAEGKADSYQQGLKDLINANQLRRNQLSQMSVSQIQEEIKKQTKLHGSQAMDGGSSMPQASTGGFFGGTAPFGQSGGSFGSGGSVIPSGGFSAVPSTSSQSGVFGSGNANNQSGLFGQSSVSGLTGSVFGNNANSTNQTMSGISSSFPATNQSGGLFGTSPDQSAASSGLFGAKTDLKPGLFGSASIPSSGLFSSGPQLQKDSGTISATSITPNNSIKTTSETSSSKEQATAVQNVSLTCSEEDMLAFMADSFVLGKIPECPPPLELC